MFARRFTTCRQFALQRLRYSTDSAATSTKSGSLPVQSKAQRQLQHRQEDPVKSALQQSRQRTQPTIYNTSGLAYALPAFLALKRTKQMIWNGVLGCALIGFASFVYEYSIWAVRQDDLTDEYLNEMQKRVDSSLVVDAEKQ